MPSDPISIPPLPSGTPTGWYPDPAGEKKARYWDGVAWSKSARDDVAFSDAPTEGGPSDVDGIGAPAADGQVGEGVTSSKTPNRPRASGISRLALMSAPIIIVVLVVVAVVSSGGSSGGQQTLASAVDADTVASAVNSALCNASGGAGGCGSANCYSSAPPSGDTIPAGDYECYAAEVPGLPAGQIYMVRYSKGAGPCPNQNPTPWTATSTEPLGDGTDDLSGCA
jgi:hypothetical protein